MAGSTSGWKVVDSPFLAVKLFFFNNLAWGPDEPLRAFVRLPGLLERPMPRNLTRRLRMRQSGQLGSLLDAVSGPFFGKLAPFAPPRFSLRHAPRGWRLACLLVVL